MAEGGGGRTSSRWRDGCGETGAWYLNLEVSEGLRAILQGSISCWSSLLLFRWALFKVVRPEQRRGREGGREGRPVQRMEGRKGDSSGGTEREQRERPEIQSRKTDVDREKSSGPAAWVRHQERDKGRR